MPWTGEVDTKGLRTRALVSRDSCSKPWGLGPGPELPKTACRPRGPSGMGLVAWDSCSTPGPSGTFRVAWDSWWTLQALGHGPETPRKAGQHRGPADNVPSLLGEMVDHARPREWARIPQVSWLNHGPSDMSAICPGGLVDPAGTCSWARNTRDSWSTPRVFGPRAESRGTGGRPLGPSDPGRSRPGRTVDPKGSQNWP